ncbi:MAG: c-type cytochrome domain-containing protein [Verrucomicrobiota bacterium]
MARFSTALLLLLAASASAKPVDYNDDVRPILSENCFYCHGPDGNKRKADLRLDVRAVALAEKAFVPGDPDASELVKRLLSKDPEEVMPPPESHRKVSPEQRETLRRWIAEGAQYREHMTANERRAMLNALRMGSDLSLKRSGGKVLEDDGAVNEGQSMTAGPMGSQMRSGRLKSTPFAFEGSDWPLGVVACV